MKFSKTTGVALLLSALAGGGAGITAQTVEGAVEGATSRVLVRLLDAEGTPVASQVTDVDGRFLLAPRSPGTYRVRAERVGYQPRVSEPVQADPGERETVRVPVPDRPLGLEQAPAPAPGQCGPMTPANDQLSLAWSSLSTAVTMTVWNSERGELLLDARLHRRELESDARTVVRAERPVEERGVSRLVPAVDPSDLLSRGFIREDEDGGTRYFGPTPAVLAHPEFLEHYCLRLQGPEDGPLLGLAFEPRPVDGTPRPGVAGVVWVARADGRPVVLEYAYRNVDPTVVPASAGGETTFAELPDGSWVTAEAWVRMPLLQVFEEPEDTVWRVAGLREERARLIRVRSDDEVWAVNPESGELRGQVRLGGGQPVPGATVELVGTTHVTESDSAGGFRFDGLLDGVYRVAADHPVFDDLPLGPSVPAVPVRLGETSSVTLSPPSAEDAAVQLCPSQENRVGAVIVTGQVLDSLSGEPLVGLPLNIRFRDPRRTGTPYHEARVSSGAGGYYVYCDAPRGQTVRVRPALPGARVRDDVTFVAMSPVERTDIRVGLSTEQAEGGVFGLVRDAESGKGIEAAEIRIAETDYRGLTNSNGFYAIPDVRPGLYTMSIQHLAYQEREIVVRMDGGRAYQVNVDLQVDAIPLEGITVSVVPSRLFGDMVDLQRRMELGFGDFMVRDELQTRGGTLASAIQGRLGLRVITTSDRPGARYVVLRGAVDLNMAPPETGLRDEEVRPEGMITVDYCFPAVWVDGRQWSQPRAGGIGHEPVDITQFVTLDLEAVEIYRGPGSVPGEFGGGDAACGALVIWTRRGGRVVRGEMTRGVGTSQEWP